MAFRTMLHCTAVAAAAWMLITAAAPAAFAGDARLDGEAVRSLMLGKRMSGIREDTAETWFECVAESGDTIYNIEGIISTGFVTVAEDGETCFTYPYADYTSHACFFAEPAGNKTVFVEVTSGTRFRVDRTDTNFEHCTDATPVS